MTIKITPRTRQIVEGVTIELNSVDLDNLIFMLSQASFLTDRVATD